MRFSQLYEQEYVPALFEAWVPGLVEPVEDTTGGRLLDLASGTGIVARVVAARRGPGARVVACDRNLDMLVTGRAAACSLPIRWQLADAGRLPFVNSSFEAVVCQQGLQHFADRRSVLREVHRVMAPSGQIALSVWGAVELSPGFAFVREVVGDVTGVPATGFIDDPFAMSDIAAVEELLTATGFEVVSADEDTQRTAFPSSERFVDLFVSSLVLAPLWEAHGEVAHQRARQVLLSALAQYCTEDGLCFPMTANIVSARRVP